MPETIKEESMAKQWVGWSFQLKDTAEIPRWFTVSLLRCNMKPSLPECYFIFCCLAAISFPTSRIIKFPLLRLLAAFPRWLFPQTDLPWTNGLGKQMCSLPENGENKRLEEMEKMLHCRRVKPEDPLFQGFCGLFRTSSDSW